MRILNKITGVMLTVVLIIALAVVGLSFVNFKCYVIESGSMEPDIQVGSVVVVNENYKYEDVKIGDVIVFKSGDSRVTHRVAEKTSDGLRTKGDANEVEDKIIITEALFSGKVLCSVPKAGFVAKMLSEPKGKILAVTFIALLAFITIISTDDEKSEDAVENK